MRLRVVAGRGHRQRRRMSIVFQDALSALNPVATVRQPDRRGAAPRPRPRPQRLAERALELLRLVGIPDPERRYRAYPHELSGGTRQRVMIAIALSSEPAILLCDEPTTALDVTIQTQILALLADLRVQRGLSLVFVTHDLSVVSQVAERLAVMYTGRLVETGPTATVLAEPRHPYTAGLLAAALDVDTPEREPLAIPGSIPDPLRLPSGCTFHPRCAASRRAECVRPTSASRRSGPATVRPACTPASSLPCRGRPVPETAPVPGAVPPQALRYDPGLSWRSTRSQVSFRRRARAACYALSTRSASRSERARSSD